MTATAILAPAKACKRCGEYKPLSAFGKAKSCTDGHLGSCKACGAESAAKRAAAWRARNPERAKEVDAKYRQANPDKVKATRAKHYQKHAEKYREASRKSYAENPEYYKRMNAQWMAENKESRAISASAWRAANPERVKANYARWEAENPDVRRTINRNRRARIRGNGGKLSKGLDAKLYALQRGMCACCGQPLGDDYNLDHIMPLSLGGKNTDDNMQLLRKKCNLQKKAKHPVDFMQSRGFLL